MPMPVSLILTTANLWFFRAVIAMPPFLFVSVERGSASQQAAEKQAGLIKSANGRAELRVLEGRTHLTANHLLGASEDTTGAILLEFVRQVTR